MQVYSKHNKLILFVCLTLLFVLNSCKKYPDPLFENLKNYYYTKWGFDQREFAGNYLKDSIKTYVFENNAIYSGAEIHYDIVKGGGSVDQNIVITDQNGKAGTKWKLGSSSCEQILRTSVYDKSGLFLSAFNFYSKSFRYNSWDTVTTHPEINISHMVADSANQVTLLVAGSTIFKQSSSYFDWNHVESNQLYTVFSIEMDKNGLIYAATWYGELLKSIDHGNSWLSCTMPIPSNPYYYYLQITSDGTVWANTWNFPLRFSKDGGSTWTITGLPVDQQPSHISRLSDGSILALTFDTKLWRSTDGGITWINLNTIGNPLYLYVTDSDDVIIITQEDGLSIKRSTDQGDHFTRVYYSSHYFTSTMWHSIHKKGDTYYIMIQGKGIVTTKDFLYFTNLWNNELIFDLFMDHHGTLIAVEFNRAKAYYYAPNPN